MDGVKSAKVDFERKLAMVEYDEAMVNHNSLETVTKTADIYKVSEMKTVNEFSAKKDCADDLHYGCCKDKTEVEKKECAENCTKACCTERKKSLILYRRYKKNHFKSGFFYVYLFIKSSISSASIGIFCIRLKGSSFLELQHHLLNEFPCFHLEYKFQVPR